MKSLRKLRNEKGLSQADLGAELGCPQNAIAQYEIGKRGTRTLRILIRAAKYFNVSTDYILGLSPQRRSLTTEEEKLAYRIMNIQDPELTEAALKILERLEVKHDQKE